MNWYPNIDYYCAARNPDGYKGKKYFFAGKISQILYGENTTDYLMRVNGSPSMLVYVTINNRDKSSDPIDDETVRVYGEYGGNCTYQTVFGSTVTKPLVIAHNIKRY